MKVNIIVLFFFIGNSFALAQRPYYFTQKILSDTNNLTENKTLLSFIGNYKAIENIESKENKAPSIKKNEIVKEKLKDAFDLVIEHSGKHKVIFLNEMSYRPRNRAFVSQILKPLYENGFHYLLSDAIDPEDSLLNSRKYPITESGYLLNEPQYGNLIRKAFQLGYHVQSYESFADENHGYSDTLKNIMVASIGEREKKQAINIKKILDRDPFAKIIVLGNSQQISSGKKENSVVNYFFQVTGLSPLVINQTEFTDIIIDKTDKAFYKSEDSLSFETLFLIPGKEEYKNNRVNWISGTRFPLKKIKIPIECPCIVTAFPLNEDFSAIPVDVIEVSDFLKTDLILPSKGVYKMNVVSEKAEFTKEISVK